jgi:hypothetical protein
MGLEDLEAKLLSPEPSKASKSRAKQEPKPKPKPEPKPSRKVTKPKEKKADSLKAELSSIPKPEPAKKVKNATAPAKKVSYSLDTPPVEKKIEKKVKVEKPKVVVQKPAAQPKMTAMPKPGPMPKLAVMPKETRSGDADANAGLVGVALGGAPLLFAPLVALSAGRSLLTKTAARREQIQQEIAEAEAAKAKKKLQSQVDAGTLGKATVRE